MKAFLVSSSDFPVIPDSLLHRKEDDLVVGVDGGTLYLRTLGILPDVIIGDGDSLPAIVLEEYKGRTELEMYPVAKDETDTELAIEWCCKKSVDEVIILNIMNGRVDHFLGLIGLLSHCDGIGLKACIETGYERIELGKSPWQPDVLPGNRVSLIPLSHRVDDVRTVGLDFPLKGETLYHSRTRGISNVAGTGKVMVTWGEGELIVVTELIMRNDG